MRQFLFLVGFALVGRINSDSIPACANICLENEINAQSTCEPTDTYCLCHIANAASEKALGSCIGLYCDEAVGEIAITAIAEQCATAQPQAPAATPAAPVATNPSAAQVTTAAIPAGSTAATQQPAKSNEASSRGGSIGLGMGIAFGAIAITRFIHLP